MTAEASNEPRSPLIARPSGRSDAPDDPFAADFPEKDSLFARPSDEPFVR